MLGKALQCPALFQSPLFSDSPQSWGDGVRIRKRIKFWIERLVINSAGDLSFSGTQFHHYTENHFLKQMHFGNGLLAERVMTVQ